MAVASYKVPGVYRQPSVRAAGLPRVRTDVAGFAGIAGDARLYQATRIDDWRSYVETFLRDARGGAVAPPAGSRLADTVRAYFANGGSRCWVVNVASSLPDEHDVEGRRNLVSDMLGLPRPGAPTVDGDGKDIRFFGLDLLLAQDEVAIVALPELDAVTTTPASRATADEPVFEEGCFFPCSSLPPPGIPSSQLPPALMDERPFFSQGEILDVQRQLLARCEREPWRAFAILGPPSGLTQDKAVTWRRKLGESGCGALYWPWLCTQSVPGQPVVLRSPVGAIAGIFARRDLARGPHVAPANETLVGAVGLEFPVDDRAHGAVYDAGVNVVRAFPGIGIQVWGARTLQWSDPRSLEDPEKDFVFVNVRRCLSAIERTAERLGEAMVFEPNLPLLRLSLVQRIVSYLTQVFEAGALAGDTVDTSFFVRSDASNNPPAMIEQGRLVCDVGVAIAAPAEFIVFRVGRNEGVVELEEGA